MYDGLKGDDMNFLNGYDPETDNDWEYEPPEMDFVEVYYMENGQ
jgi:hypothetical protein